MKRDLLIQQVKDEYAGIASSESQFNFDQTTDDITPDAYYEHLLSSVIAEISNGTFDHCRSGSEIVNIVANDKTVLSQWK